MKKIKVISCVATIGIMALIFWFSSQNSDDSSDVSRGFLMFIINLFPGTADLDADAKLELIYSLHGHIRKIAHFSIYTALGVSSAAAVWSISGMPVKRSLLISVPFCALYSLTDEFHQSFVSGRSGELRDMLIDTSGALFGGLLLVLSVSLVMRMKYKKRQINDN